MLKIYNWFLTMSPNTSFYISKDMYEEAMKVSFNHAEIYVRGQLYKSDKDKLEAIVFKVKNIKNDVAFSKNKKYYKLINKLENYIQYEEAVFDKIPIIYDWIVGKDQNNDLSITGMLYKNGLMIPITKKIRNHDKEKSKLILSNNETIFLVWGAMNEYYKQHLITSLKKDNSIIFETQIDFCKCYECLPNISDIVNKIIENKSQQKIYTFNYYKK